jgi:hypothetical protein
MKNIGLALLVLTLASPLAATEWKGVSLMDTNCSTKKATLEHPEDHTAMCAMKCKKSGYGVIVDGKYVKFDKNGSKLASAALAKTKKKDHLTATVVGEMKGDQIAVKSLKLD